jgi:hypothetical protein
MAEIRVKDEQGNIHVFPNGSTPDMIAKVLNVQPPNQYGLSGQDMSDLRQIRSSMPKGDPRTAKIDTLLSGQQQTLAARIKAKYPGVYDDMDDYSLEQKVLAKYPDYGDMPRTPAPNANPQQPSFAERLVSAYNPSASNYAEKHPILGPAVRFLDAAGGAALSVPSSLYHAVADPLTPQEEQEFQGHTRIPGELALERLTGAPLVHGAQQYANPETRPSLKGALSVLPEALGQGVGGYAGSELLGKGAGKALDTAVPALQKSATTQYIKALSPTKAKNKFIAQKIAPEMIQRGVSGSLEGIREQARTAMDDVGPQIDQAIKAIPQAKQLAIQPVLDALESYKQEGTVQGIKVDPDLVKRADQLQRIVKQFGPDISYESLNRVRRIWDAKVAKAGGYAGQTLSEGSMIDAMREGATAIRSELAKDRPDIAKLNSEYSFWSKVQQVTGDTIQRRSGQEGALMPKLAGIGGAAASHTPMGIAMYALGRVVQSPRWRTFSAVKKTQIANAIAAGDAAAVTKLAGVGASAYGAQQQ